jgi:hypothetical protein
LRRAPSSVVRVQAMVDFTLVVLASLGLMYWLWR